MNRIATHVGAGMGWAVLWGLIGMSGCSTEPTDGVEPKAAGIARQVVQELPTVACPGLGDVEVQYVLYVLKDRTGSYFSSQEMVEQMKAEAVRYIRALPSGSAVYVAYISESSARRQELVMKDVIPFEPAEVVCDLSNPFDRAKRQHCAKLKQEREARQACVQEAYRRMEQAINDLVPPVKAPRTDMTGALLMAGEVLSAYPQAERAVVILSDGVDTEKKPLPTRADGFSGATVVFRPPLGQAGEADRSPIRTYAAAIDSWGGKTSVAPLSVPVTAKLFQQTRSAGTDHEQSTIDVAHR